MSDHRCHATTKNGQSCKAAPLKGRDVCLAHADAETRASAGFVADNGQGGRPKQPSVTAVYAEELHRRVGEHIELLIGRLVDIALDAERTVVVGTGPNARTEIAPDQGLQLAALRELNDRILGRPKQATEITGAGGGPVTVTLPPDAGWHAQVAEVLAEAGAVTALAATANGAATGNGQGNGNGHRPDPA